MELVLGRHDLKVLLSQLSKTVLKFTYGEGLLENLSLLLLDNLTQSIHY